MELENQYYLTDRQHEAKERMENMLNSWKRWFFTSKEEFDNYMKSLIKRLNKKIKTSNAVKEWKISYEEINKKHKEKIKKFYEEDNKLYNYAVKYIKKWYPSENKLREKLKQKSDNEDFINEVIKKLNEKNIQYKDNILIDMYINNYISMWKNYEKIKTLLIRKQFNIDLVRKHIDIKKEETDWSLLDPFSTERKVLSLLKKWKSEFYIINKLCDTYYDKELVSEILKDINFDNTEIMLKELSKLKDKNLDKQKIITRMYSKGYSYNDIKEYL